MPRKNKKFEGDEDAVFKPAKRMITTRVPVALHSLLIQEAADYGISMNLLCIEKLQQPIQQFSWEKHDKKESEKGVQPVQGSDSTIQHPEDGATEQSG